MWGPWFILIYDSNKDHSLPSEPHILFSTAWNWRLSPWSVCRGEMAREPRAFFLLNFYAAWRSWNRPTISKYPVAIVMWTGSNIDADYRCWVLARCGRFTFNSFVCQSLHRLHEFGSCGFVLVCSQESHGYRFANATFSILLSFNSDILTIARSLQLPVQWKLFFLFGCCFFLNVQLLALCDAFWGGISLAWSSQAHTSACEHRSSTHLLFTPSVCAEQPIRIKLVQRDEFKVREA